MGIGANIAIFSVVKAVLLAPLPFGVDPVDLPTFGVVGAVLAGVAALASRLPARRAAAVDPAVTLRQE